MIKLSVVIITYNEEKNIERCLQSVQGIADEIVVLDSFSTDNTKSICQSYNVRFFQHVFDGHIEQKNRAITYTSFPYILMLDADEALSEELKQSIAAVKNNWQADGYYFNRLTNYCGHWVKHGGWYPDRKLRLADKRKGHWTGINPHDRYELEEGATSKFLSGDLLHYSYHSISQHIAQYNKFTDIGAQEAFKRGKRSNLAIMLIKSFWKFIRDYFIKLGFLDGYYGFLICALSAHATFLKYAKLKELQQKSKTG